MTCITAIIYLTFPTHKDEKTHIIHLHTYIIGERTKFDTEQKSSKSLIEIMTLVSSANNTGSDTSFILRGRSYTGCPRRNGQNFGRVFLMLNYTDITQNTYIQS